jgi:lipid-A-disaccharide synthase-like uncharacterized protein
MLHISQADLPHTPGQWTWVAIGIIGQAIFGFRFFLQWLHSERHGESKIPISFWWMSEVGVLMTAAFCLYRRQFILLLGNGPQLVPYTRNLILIYRKRRRDLEALAA